jgi:hypothetical protein
MLHRPLLRHACTPIARNQGFWRGMIRGGALFGVGVALAGCSLVGLGYNRLPELAQWWLQRQLPLSSEQTEPLRRELHTWLQWHRQTQLQPTAAMLRRWQTLAAGDVSADQACQEWREVRVLLDAAVLQALPALTRLAQSLDAAQREALADTQRQGHEAFRQAHLAPPSRADWLGLVRADAGAPDRIRATSLAHRLERAQERFQRLYGPLQTAQTEALSQKLQASAFPALRVAAERERRTADLLDTLAQMAHPAVTEPQARRLLAGWVERLSASPTPGYGELSRQLTREACEQLAAVHHHATPAQRQHAVQVLAGYETELRALMPR